MQSQLTPAALNPVGFGVKAIFLLIIGERSNHDVIAIVHYPNRQAFLDMTASAEYQEAQKHREAGLAHQLLMCCAGNEPPLP